ncbi:MAG: hypothetical protein Q4A28_10610, partial [Brachymonas sp.]|nr:hypothetical protein [Brachymonas sp.]
RIGHVRWLRNLAVALGNALRTAAQQGDAPQMQAIASALQQQARHPEALVREHVAWALAQAVEASAGAARQPAAESMAEAAAETGVDGVEQQNAQIAYSLAAASDWQK